MAQLGGIFASLLPILMRAIVLKSPPTDQRPACLNLDFDDNLVHAWDTKAGGMQVVYRGVAEVDGVVVNLRVSTHAHGVAKATKVGLYGHLGQIEMSSDAESTFTFEFVDDDGTAVVLSPCVYFTILDLDCCSHGGEKLKFFLDNFTVTPSLFRSKHSGISTRTNLGHDLVLESVPTNKKVGKPSHPNHLTSEQLDLSATIVLEQASRFSMRYRTPKCPSSRSFLFGGHVHIGDLVNVEPLSKRQPRTFSRDAADVLKDPFATPKPNIIWVMSDDLGWGEVGMYPAESEHGRLSTPNLDKFGSEGMQFMNAYTGYSVCAPSRTSFFTGLHAGRFAHHGLNGESVPLSSNLTTLVEMLQGAGYWTGAVGKISPLVKPLHQGFDRFIGQIDQGECHNMYPAALDSADGHWNFPLEGNVGDMTRERCMLEATSVNYTMDVFHSIAMRWLHERANHPDVPFFLYLAYTVPHAGGYQGVMTQGNPVPTNRFYESADFKVVEKDHASVVTYMDMLFGELMDLLKTVEIDKNTLVFFASDNGAHQEGGHNHYYFNSTGGLRGLKRSLYEGGVRSPTMVRWPGHIQAGSRSYLSWAFWDVFPTFADIVGAKLPIVDHLADGISIAPTLFGENARQAVHQFMYFTWAGGYSLHQGRYKGVVPLSNIPMKPDMDDTMELYDLWNDPFEEEDISEQHAGIVTQMKHVVIHNGFDGRCFQCYYRKSWQEIWDKVGFAWELPY